MSTDQAYWQVIISLVNKKETGRRLSQTFAAAGQRCGKDDCRRSCDTKADGLSVRVKVNEAEMTLTKVEDGLSLGPNVVVSTMWH